MSPPTLPALFFARDAERVAEELLGMVIVRHGLRARIVETEAYLGPHDQACHTAKGRTKRNEIMFGPPGVAYVYFIYGIYDMLNFVTGDHTGQAVLIRAAEPLEGFAPGQRLDGPGKLARALGITTREHNGLVLGTPALTVEAGPSPSRHFRGPRIGIDYAGAWRDAPLRFCVEGTPHLSRK